MNRRLAIIGASTLGRLVAHKAALLAEPFEIVGFSTIGAGSVKDIGERGVYVGCPARKMERRNDSL